MSEMRVTSRDPIGTLFGAAPINPDQAIATPDGRKAEGGWQNLAELGA